jgi:FkbM family methyltransferase
MVFKNRTHVETTGLQGRETFVKDSFQISKQLDSYWVASKLNDAGISHHFKDDGFWEAWITLWMSRNVKPGSYCIDGGPNYGYYTFFLEKQGCEVLAVEANPEIISFLNKSIELNKCGSRVTVINKAITDKTGDFINLNILPSSLNSTIIEQHPDGPTQKTFKVETISLDSIERPVDFIKLDIEGAEELAWKGMENLLKRNPQCVVLLEFVYPHYLENGKYFFESLSKNHKLTYVDYNGDEQPFTQDMLTGDEEPYRMVVIRSL